MKKQIAILALVLFALFCMTAAYATEVATGSIYGVWENTELDFEFHLNTDGTGYTVRGGKAKVRRIDRRAAKTRRRNHDLACARRHGHGGSCVPDAFVHRYRTKPLHLAVVSVRRIGGSAGG